MAKSVNPRVRLGRGQRTAGDAAVWAARRLFLRAVATVAPDAYRSLFPDGSGREALERQWDRWADDATAAVAAWQAQWNLTADWCAEVANATIRARLESHVAGLTTLVGINGPPPDLFVTPDIRDLRSGGHFGLPASQLFWNPGDETRSEAHERIMALVDLELDRIEAACPLPATPTRAPDQYVWLARFQVGGETRDDIAATLPANVRRTAGQGINRTALAIGLMLRDAPGFPRQ